MTDNPLWLFVGGFIFMVGIPVSNMWMVYLSWVGGDRTVWRYIVYAVVIVAPPTWFTLKHLLEVV